MPPFSMLEEAPETNKATFFDRIDTKTTGSGTGTQGQGQGISHDSSNNKECTVYSSDGTVYYLLKRPAKNNAPAPRTLAQIVGLDSGGPYGRRKGEAGHTEGKSCVEV